MLRTSTLPYLTLVLSAAMTGCLAGSGRAYLAASVDTSGVPQGEVGFSVDIGMTTRQWRSVALQADGVVGTDTVYAARVGLAHQRHGDDGVGLRAAVVAQVGIADRIHGVWSDNALLFALTKRRITHDRGLSHLTHERRGWTLGILARVGLLHHADEWNGRFGTGLSIGYESLQRTEPRPRPLRHDQQ